MTARPPPASLRAPPAADCPALIELSELYGVCPAYRDVNHRIQRASPESLLLVLSALGAPLSRMEDAAEAVRAVRSETWRRLVEPVVVRWGDAPLRIDLRRPSDLTGIVELALSSADGTTIAVSERPIDDLPCVRSVMVDGRRYEVRRLVQNVPVQPGYYRMAVTFAGETNEVLLISAPDRVLAEKSEPAWGLFAPLYALRSSQDCGAGDLGVLGELVEWVGELGGRLVGTLPLLAQFIDEPFEPSPYSPLSRLFYNELFIDVRRIDELTSSPGARSIVESADFGRAVEGLRGQDMLDHRKVMALKRRVLEELCRSLDECAPARAETLRRFSIERKDTLDYARFRAGVERFGAFQSWPERMQSRGIGEGDVDEDAVRRHLYAQLLLDEQLRALRKRARENDVELYFDLPLGVHPAGYDVFRERDAFVTGASAGAPPDDFFREGQIWGFPPLHPRRMRETGHGYLRTVLERHLQFARWLRVDHVMGLERLFFVPEGARATDGVYVRYPADELYAVLALEAHRNQGVIVGEDLGTVPESVRVKMAEHGLLGMYVAQFEAAAEGGPKPVPQRSLAALNTHDTPTFAGYLRETDLDDQRELGLVDSEQDGESRAERRRAVASLEHKLVSEGYLAGNGAEKLVQGAYRWLAASPATMVLVNLEDLWLEARPHNVPGTHLERPNWRRKAAYCLDEIRQMPGPASLLRALTELRR